MFSRVLTSMLPPRAWCKSVFTHTISCLLTLYLVFVLSHKTILIQSRGLFISGVKSRFALRERDERGGRGGGGGGHGGAKRGREQPVR
jgi:hypothetical protein